MPTPKQPSGRPPERRPRRRAPDPLREAAGRIADGRTVDWDALLARTDESLHSRLQRLRGIEQLAESCRGAAIERDADAPVSDTVPRGEPLFQWGNLQVLEKVGEGGFGEVFRAWDPVLEREVALKLRRARGSGRSRAAGEEARRLHLEEARRLARLRHPNVLAVYGMEEHAGRAGLWTEFVHGGTLEERLAEEGPWPLDRLERIGRDLCCALEAAHASAIIHGDVKASNVMIDPSGRAVLMDFGSASGSGESSGPLTGTPLAMAPELFRGMPPSVASDLYALGALLYRLATGRYPIEARTRAELERIITAGPRLPLSELRPELPESFAQVVARALATAPEERFRTARQMEAAIAAAAGVIETVEAGNAVGDSTGLPREATAFIGRSAELRELSSLLLRARLVTLLGPGGSGKTRLASRASRQRSALFPDGVWWIALASLSTSDQIWQAVAHRVGARDAGRAPLDQLVLDLLAQKTALLVLDNCEHLSAEAAGVARELLEACPRLGLLATSRVPLGLPEESTLSVRPMEVPPRPRGGAGEGLEIADREAVRLFLDRAAAARPGFRLTRENAPAVARICRRVDGIPLALELAAARTRSLTVEDLAARLESGLQWLRRPGEDGEARARTLEASIDWSWRLLDEEEQATLRRLSVFAGRFALAAAEGVAFASGECAQAIDRLESLVEKSLVIFEVPSPELPDPPGEGPLSYRLLEPIREFAAARLRESGEEEAILRRHFDRALAQARKADPFLLRGEQDLWLARLEAEHDDLRAALHWARAESDRAPLGLDLCQHLRRFWFVRGYLSEGIANFQGLLAEGNLDRDLRTRSLGALASLAWAATDLAGARRYCEEALEAADREVDPRGYGAVAGMLGTVCSDLGDRSAARTWFETALAIQVELGNRTPQAALLNNLGASAGLSGDPRAAAEYYTRSLEIYRELKDHALVSTVLGNLCTTYLDLKQVEQAREAADEGLAVVRASGDRRAIQMALDARARVALAEEQPSRARTLAVESLSHRLDDTDWRCAIHAAEILAEAELSLGRPERAALFLGLARARRARLEFRALLAETERYERLGDRLREALGPDPAEAADRRGGLLEFPDLLRLAAE